METPKTTFEFIQPNQQHIHNIYQNIVQVDIGPVLTPRCIHTNRFNAITYSFTAQWHSSRLTQIITPSLLRLFEEELQSQRNTSYLLSHTSESISICKQVSVEIKNHIQNLECCYRNGDRDHGRCGSKF